MCISHRSCGPGYSHNVVSGTAQGSCFSLREARLFILAFDANQASEHKRGRSPEMSQLHPSLKVSDGLMEDPQTGNYRVMPGYSQQALRYAIHESWLDEDDTLWVSREAVERERRREGGSEDGRR